MKCRSYLSILFVFLLLLGTFTLKAQDGLIAILNKGDAQQLDTFFTKRHEQHDHAKFGCNRQVFYYEILPDSRYRRVFASYLYYDELHSCRERVYVSAIVDDKTILIWRLERERRPDEYEVDTSSSVVVEYDDMEEMLKATVVEYNNVEEVFDYSFIPTEGMNKLEYLKFAATYKGFYGAEFNKELNFIRTSFGFCGLYGYWENPYRTIAGILKKADNDVFEKWLRSGNVGMQLYAMEGFQHSGLPISSNTRKVIEFVLSTDPPIEDCDGCTSTMSTLQVIAQKKGYFDLLKK